ncbi:uncharacterized protein L203_103638 [Cryptococcus depauperatus CBS 7841]|uniref:MIF4G domain-containing protein n=1 Tax=Cryptococcus depauperatus CBS 7841 TaxID=1295531 RepID=A0AAJ8JTX7_9TREE
MAPQTTPIRPNGAGLQTVARPAMPQPGMPPYGMVPHGPAQYSMMGYPQQGYYPTYNVYDQQSFGMPPQQWAPQHHPQGQYAGNFNVRPMSPPQSSPAPFQPGQTLPRNATVATNDSPPSFRPLSSNHQATPSNTSSGPVPKSPVRPINITAPSFNHLSGGSATFNPVTLAPRRSAAIAIKKPDGTIIDLGETKKAPSSTASSHVSTPTPVTPSTLTTVKAKSEQPKKPVFSLPVVVKIEKPEEKELRLKEEAERKKLKEQEERAERERLERLRKKAEDDGQQKPIQDEEQPGREKAEQNGENVIEMSISEAEKKSSEDELAQCDIDVPSVNFSIPTKPAHAVNGLKDVPASPKLETELSTFIVEPSTSALTSAKPIIDIRSITYPGLLKSPNVELNISAQPSKFRYDREFLMQFMNICKEKPEDLPNLEEIGLDAEGSSGFGSRGPRGGRSSMGPPSRAGSISTGAGIGGMTRASMGSFGTGQFGSMPVSLRNTTSEQRYRASLSGRPSSQGFPSMAGLPPMSLSNSRSGRGSQRGSKRAPPSQTPAAASIPISENAWTRTRLGGDAEGTPGYIERKVKALLNKLTEEKFDQISLQILEWANKSRNETNGLTLKLVIKQIFEKATDEAHWSSMYAKLCRLLHDELDPEVTEIIGEKPVSGRTLFRKYLLGRCQMDFENGWKAREDTAVAAAAKQKEDGEKQEKAKESGDKEADLMSDEYYAAQKAKRRGLGLVQLIGELFKREILSSRVISECLIKLLSNVLDPDEEDIESACKLLATVGPAYDRVASDNLNKAYIRLDEILKLESLSSRIKFMIMDVIDLRKEGWRSRKQQAGVMTIAEIHKQNAQEKSAAAAAVVAKESISRGGSRAGRDRRDGGLQPGEWQAVQSGARTLSRPTDFSGMGKNMSASGNAPSFGPSSVFASRKGKGNTAGMTTPPISRQPSSANMFSALNDAHEAEAAGGDGGEPGAQRKRLNLAPRTKPIPGDEREGEGEMEAEVEVEVEVEGDGESGGEEEIEELSEERAKAKIDVDMKELWGEKDQGGSRNPVDIVEYFVSLPESRRPLLAERLVSDIFRISKTKEAQIVAKGWRMALDQQSVTVDVLRQSLEGRMATLDDEAIDFPGAYSAVAYLVRGIDLSQEDVEGLGEKIEMEGTPLITPKQKLEKALAKVDEEAST